MVAAPYGQPQQVIQPITSQNVPRYIPPRNYMWIILVGIIVLLVGGIITTSWGFIDPPDDRDDREGYNDTIRTLNATGHLLEYIGLIAMCTGMIFGAIKDESLHPNVRLGMFIAMGLIVGFKIMSLIWWTNP